jgi:hypothetical protein
MTKNTRSPQSLLLYQRHDNADSVLFFVRVCASFDADENATETVGELLLGLTSDLVFDLVLGQLVLVGVKQTGSVHHLENIRGSRHRVLDVGPTCTSSAGRRSKDIGVAHHKFSILYLQHSVAHGGLATAGLAHKNEIDCTNDGTLHGVYFQMPSTCTSKIFFV